jgi:hypothetical protein
MIFMTKEEKIASQEQKKKDFLQELEPILEKYNYYLTYFDDQPPYHPAFCFMGRFMDKDIAMMSARLYD